MSGAWYADAGSREALFATRPRALLFGSFRGYANFGDLLQLQGTLRWHRRLGGPDPVVVCDAASIADADFAARLRARLGGAALLFYSEERLDLRPAGLEELDETPQVPLLHVYGGGFLNGVWGAASLRRIESLHARFAVQRYVLSGQQVGPEICDALARHFARCRPALAGGRDADSVERLRRCGVEALACFDDGAEALFALADRLPAGPARGGGAVVHLNLSAYTGEPEVRRAALRERLARLHARLEPAFAGVTLLHAYADRRAEIVDSLAAVRELEDGFPFPEVRLLDLAALAADPWGEAGTPPPARPQAELALSSSYHVALFCARLGIPCFLEADNAFYRQKREALGLRRARFEDFLERPERPRLDAGLEARATWQARLAALVEATPEPGPERRPRPASDGPPRPWRPRTGAAAELAGLRDWIAEQERAKRWLDGQRRTWLAIAEEREARLRAQQRWIRSLEDGKRWLERRLWEQTR